MPRVPSPSFLAAVLPALLVAACGEAGPPPVPPLPPEALEAVAENPGVDREKLARAIDTLFTAEGIGETRAVVVMHGGEIVAERYADGYDRDTRFVGWSMSKTVTAVLIGMLVADGRLHLDRSPPIPRCSTPISPRSPATRPTACAATAARRGPAWRSAPPAPWSGWPGRSPSPR